MGQGRDVPPGPRQIGHEPGTNRIADTRSDDRNRRGGALGRQRCRDAEGHDHVHVQLDQFGDEGRETIVGAFRRPVYDDIVVSLDIVERAHALSKRGKDPCGASDVGAASENTDPRNFPRRRRRGGERRREEGQDNYPNKPEDMKPHGDLFMSHVDLVHLDGQRDETLLI
jgi:hypothetical protein